MKGRKRKPNEVHEANGNPSKLNLTKRKARTPRALAADPVPPVFLTKWAKLYWRKLFPVVEQMRVMTCADEVAFAELCELLAEQRWYRGNLAEMRGTESGLKEKDEGDIVEGSTGQQQLHPYARVTPTLSRRVLQYLEHFGLTPSARARIQLDPGDEEDDLLKQIALMN